MTASEGRPVSANVEQWCDRYNLEKIHRLTLGRLRSEIEPCTDHEYAAFRLRWFHVGGAGISADQSGVAAVLDQLSGLAFSPELWERAILPARVPGYRPEWLDLLCLGGEIVWAAVPNDELSDDLPARITFVRRRRAGRVPGEAADRVAAQITNHDDLAVFVALVAGGAQYLDQLAERAGLAERVALAALWRLAAAGRVSNDSFAPLRLLWTAPETLRAIGSGTASRRARHDAALRARLRSSVAGRWSALGAAAAVDFGAAGPNATDGADAVETARARGEARDIARGRALALLERNGIVAREMLGLESPPVTWREISFALRRLEYAGAVRRGYFVHSLSGEQYALPAALEMLAAARNLNLARERPVALSATDPANPYGAVLAGCGVARDAANFVVMRAGRVMLGLAGRTLLGAGELDDQSFAAALGALIELRRKLVIDMIDGVEALGAPQVEAMAATGFHSDGRALVYDGLPGPAPMRAATRF